MGDNDKEYLGDGAYVEDVGNGSYRLFTSDGIQDLNEVYLDSQVLNTFLSYLEKKGVLRK